jgi:hypothetical protein
MRPPGLTFLRPCFLLTLGFALAGCTRTTPPEPLPGSTADGRPRWVLQPDRVVHHRVEVREDGAEALTIRYSLPLPRPLGETFVTDLALGVLDPRAPHMYRITPDSRDVAATLARAPEVGNPRSGLLDAASGTVELDRREGDAFVGRAHLQFVDPLHDDAVYVVVARFTAQVR